MQDSNPVQLSYNPPVALHPIVATLQGFRSFKPTLLAQGRESGREHL